MEQYIIDTNVFSDFLNHSFSQNGMDFLSNLIDSDFKISIITKIELLCWKTDINAEFWIKEFISKSHVIGINDTIVENCIKIRRSKKIKTPDAIIAATALSLGLTIITNNIKDFENVDGLKFLNPYTL